jgi:S1-C subfamily serine protease
MAVKVVLMLSRRQPTVMRGVLLAVAVAIAAVVGHFAWSAGSSLHVTPASSRLFGSSGPFGSGGSFRAPGSGEGGEGGPGRSLGGEGGADESEAGQSGQGGSSSQSVSEAVTSKVDPGLVDINTVLGVQGGEAAGTGMVVTSSGEVITNNHVIAGATKITATDVGNGNTYTARVVGYDYGHDIAVLQLEGASGLQTVSFGHPSTLKVGQSIATIGNAGGTGGTPSATGGQVVALDQSITAGDEPVKSWAWTPPPRRPSGWKPPATRVSRSRSTPCRRSPAKSGRDTARARSTSARRQCSACW